MQDSTFWSSKFVYDSTSTSKADTLINICKTYIGLPYRYGGCDPRGFDCSGFVLYSFNRVGVKLPHHSGEQMKHGAAISKENAMPGDIIFFGYYNKKRRSTYISHSGIVISNEAGKIYFIHSASSIGIRVDCLDQDWYRKRFKGLRRVL